jgi:hypothetical protein
MNAGILPWNVIRTPLQILSTYSPYVNIFISNLALELYTSPQITYASVHHSKWFPGQHHILVSCATFRITSSTYPNIHNAFLHYRDTPLNAVGVRNSVRAPKFTELPHSEAVRTLRDIGSIRKLDVTLIQKPSVSLLLGFSLSRVARAPNEVEHKK